MNNIDGSLLVSAAPQQLQIEVTSRCNLKCKMCPLTTGNTLSSASPGHMTDVLWDALLPLAKRYGNVILTGYGEPFMNPNFLPLLKELNQAKVSMGMSTNGTLLTKALARELDELEHLVHINFSIDSPEEEGYHYIRGGSVEKALKGLKNLMEVIKDPNRVTVSSVLMTHNMKDLVHFPAVLAELGVRNLVLQGLMDYNASCSEDQLHHKRELFGYLDEIHQRCKEVGIEITLPMAERLKLERYNLQKAIRCFHATDMESGETRQCIVPWEIPFIDREGRVFPCCTASGDVTAVMGDLRHESWDDIWNGQRFREFRKRLLYGTSISSVCQGCNSASRGKHPLLYAAKILSDQSQLSGKGPMKLVVKNIGGYTWTQNDPIRIGTSAPRNRPSRLRNATWVRASRPTHFKEKQVPPGGLATFEFEVNATTSQVSESFELVYEDLTWMNNTQFIVNVPRKVSSIPMLYAARIIRTFRAVLYR